MARSNVNRLLANLPGCWGLLSTWEVFWAYALVPVVLFWFLDYTSALQDTSLFAALTVAFGYQQIFAGGVEGILMPGQTQRLWKPFQTWVNQVADRIATRQKRDRDRFDDQVRTYLASDPRRVQGLLTLALFYSKKRQELEQQLANLEQEPVPANVLAEAFDEMQNQKKVGILFQELRASEPENYGYFLYKQGLISRWKYWNWLRDARAKTVAWIMATLIAVGFVAAFTFSYRSESVQIRYHRWRFAKPNVSEQDRFRSREYLSQQPKTRADTVIMPLLAQLRFKEVSLRLADDVLRLVVDFHSPPVNADVIPQLVETLRTENADVRLRVQRTLLALQEADYPGVTVEKTAAEWRPVKDESAGDIDRHVRAWQTWWDKVRQAQSTSPAPTSQPSFH